MQVDSETQLKQVKFDNLYDILFTSSGKQKEHTYQKVRFTDDKLDVLEQGGKNLKISNTIGDKKAIEVDKLKISK